jgi:mono/diheme cytochrome c family protein
MRKIAATMVLLGAVLLCLPPQAGAGEKKAPSGGELYAQNCGRCHEPRPPLERTDKEWRTLILHMRVRANLTGEDARRIVQFMQKMN